MGMDTQVCAEGSEVINSYYCISIINNLDHLLSVYVVDLLVGAWAADRAFAYRYDVIKSKGK